MAKARIPDLTFSSIKFTARETPWDLRYMLYRNGTDFNAPEFAKLGVPTLGLPLLERLPLILELHQIIEGRAVGGTRRSTLKMTMSCLRYFYTWANTVGRSPTLSSVKTDFLDWSEYLLQQHSPSGESQISYYGYAYFVASLLDEVLTSKTKLMRQTRMVYSKMVQKRQIRSTAADKQNLTDMFEFGNTLLDIADGLSLDTIRGNLPVRIQLRSGLVMEEWSGLMPTDQVKSLSGRASKHDQQSAMLSREAWEADTTLRTRHPLTNLRVEAELLIFIAQTGMNVSQARKLKVASFSYVSHLDGYQVRRVYKGRRKGEVEFSIYSEYREFFERYLAWRSSMFPDDDSLFPLRSVNGPRKQYATEFRALMTRCARLKIRFFGPQILRRTRQNWLLRRSLNPALTAEMGQHSIETLLRDYAEPHHRVAIVEISRFHSGTDPAIAAPGPGVCVDNHARRIADASSEAPPPDCVSPAGCLFCQHQRDVDNEDHVWSLASYRYLKSLELAKYRPSSKAQGPHPAALVISRVTAKLRVFQAVDTKRANWVCEALARVSEGDFHPEWDGFIQLIEANV